MSYLVVINILFLWFCKSACGTECAPDLSSVGDSVITLSDELSDAYTAEERCEELGGYLVVTREAEVNRTLTQAASQKYDDNNADITRVWIYYNNDTDNIYKYSLSSNEASPWVSPQHLGHLWYLDLYTTSFVLGVTVYFCAAHEATDEKWTVGSNKSCDDGTWVEQFVLYGLGSPEAGYKAIYAYNQGEKPWSVRLTDVEDDNYNGFNNGKNTFYALDLTSEVLFGARYDVTDHQWKWSDGEIAEFTDDSHTTCQQKIWDHKVEKTLNKACTNTTAYYSCQIRASFGFEEIECNSKALNISWNLLLLTTKYNKTLEVKVSAINMDGGPMQNVTAKDECSVILDGLSPNTNYTITVSGSFGCDDISLTSSFNHTTGPGSPNDVTHPYVIKSGDICNITFANPLPKGSFNITISANDDEMMFIPSSSCGQELCELPVDLTKYNHGETIEFTVKAENCEGITNTRNVAGYCVGLDHNTEPDCGPTLTSSGEFVETLSNDFTSSSEAENMCLMLGGNLTQLNESDLGETLYSRLTEKYLKDIQRIWVYRNVSNDQLYKYSFSNTSDDGWMVPSEDESISYFDLYNRKVDELESIYFCKSADGFPEKWQISTTGCLENWRLLFYLFGQTEESNGFKKIYMFKSTNTGSVKLKITNETDDGFENVGEFAIPDVNVYVGQIESNPNLAAKNSCQTTRLHYDNGWQKVDGCSGDLPSHYACSVSPGLDYEHVPCNSTSMRITWNDKLSKLNSLLPEIEIKFNVSISTEGIYDVQNVPYSKLEANITGFEPRNNYSTDVNIMVSAGCVGLSLGKTLNYETGLGTPDDVISSYITTKADKLFVNVPEFYEKKFYDKRTYTISATNGNTYHRTSEDDFGDGIQEFEINTEDFKEEKEVDFTIRCSTCESKSWVKDVAGTYFVPIEQDTQVCSTTLIAADERILTLSDDLIGISDVDNACMELGGNLTIINSLTNNIEHHLNAKYLQDLQRVWIYEDAHYSSYSLFQHPTFKYESGLEFIDMFNRIEASLQKVTFCQPVNDTLQKWQVGITPCGQKGWKEVFALFASNTSLPGYSPIYIHTSGEDWSSKLSAESTNNESADTTGPFYVPNFNLFVASESIEGCPITTLHYGSGWDLMEPCSITEAYYSCQVQFTPVVEAIYCNSSQLKVSWPSILENVDNLNKNVVVTGSGFLEITVSYDERFTFITGLTQRTIYSLEVTAVFGGCLEHSILHTLVAETSYGLADPVTDARIDSTSTVCTIVMPGDPIGNVLQYVIAAESVLSTTYHEYKLPSSGSNAEIRMNISTEYHGNNERINFTIQAITCEGPNELVDVSGFCTSPKAISPTPIGAIIGSIFGVLAALALCAAGFVYYKKRRSQKSTESDIQQSALEDIYAEAVDPETSSLSKHLLFGMYLSDSENGFQGIQDEFKKIQEESERTEPLNDVSQLSENSTKNRYRNIYPMDHARVKLIGKAENDYINASYIAGYKNERKFIASQGPKQTTIDDFWMMVWEQSSPIVVMLTGLKENGKTKCDQYWPEVGCSATFGKYRINTLEENCFGDIIQRKFGVSTAGEQRMVTQFHYIGWPDHGTPITTTSLIRLRKMVEESHDRQNPIVVHCSAGVGRTGTYIAMDVLFNEIDNGGKVDLKKCVLRMRTNRSEMVQNWKQYALVKKILVEYVSLPDSDKRITRLQRMSKAEINQLANREFATLKTWRYGENWIPGNTNLTTYDSNTVKIWSERRQEIVILNASYIESLKFGGKFIAMQYPVAGQEEEFWQILSMKKASVLVCLDESSPLGFATDQQFGDINLQFNNFQEEDSFSTHDALLSSSRQESFEFEVCVIKANTWKKKPPSANDLIKLIGKMQEMKAKKQGDYVLVCCKNGCDKTGTFIALVNILERLKSENRVDVFRTIKDLRDMRPNMVDSLELYSYCYSVVLDYLSLFSAYENFSFSSDEAKVRSEVDNDPVYCNVPRVNN